MAHVSRPSSIDLGEELSMVLLHRGAKSLQQLVTQAGRLQVKVISALVTQSAKHRKCFKTFDSNVNLFLNSLEQYFDSISRDIKIIWTGDLNFDLLNNSIDTDIYLNILLGAGLIQCIDRPTRVTNNTATCLDNFFLKYDDINDVQSADTPNSAHTYIDHTLLRQSLSRANWDAIVDNQDVDCCSADFCQEFAIVIDTSRRPSRRPSTRMKKIKPWITSDLILLIRERDKLSKKLKKQPLNLDLKMRYHNCRNNVTNTFRIIERLYFREKLNQSQNNPKMFWKTINELAGRSNAKQNVPINKILPNISSVIPNSILVEVADDFNAFFSAVGQTLAGSIDSGGALVVDDMDYIPDTQFTLHTVTELDILRHTNALRCGSAPGIDGVTASFLKDNIHIFIKPFLHIINLSMKKGIFPDVFKIAKVFPLHKSGSYTDENNFLNDKNVSDVLFDVSKQLHYSLSGGLRPILIFLDLKKAFDSIDRKILLRKLLALGVAGNAYLCFASYLTNRRQCLSEILNFNEIKQVYHALVQSLLSYGLLAWGAAYQVHVSRVNKTEFAARDYQDELLPLAVQNNCIIYLPTGSGKTFLATMIIKHFSVDIEKRLSEGGKRAFFLVNTVQLVEQQAQSIQRQTNFEVGQYTGQTGCDLWSEDVWKKELDDKSVIVMTAQILLNLLSHYYLKLSNIRIIVFDECHAAVKEHPMRCIMKFFEGVPPEQQPHVVGLTGSLLNSTVNEAQVSKYIRELENTFQSRVITSVDEKMALAIARYSTDPRQIIVQFSPGHHMSSSLCTDVKQVLDVVTHMLGLLDLKMEEDFARVRPSKHAVAMEKTNELNKKLANMIVDIKFQMENLGAYGGFKATLAMMILLERKKRSAQLQKHSNAYQFIITLLTYARKIFSDVIDKYEGEERVKSFLSNKVLKLLDLLADFKETDRALIFVTRRFTSKCLHYILEDLKLPNVKCDFIVGYNTNPFNDTREGLLEKKVNKKVLKTFNSGEKNILIASDVLEEGIDVQSCNIVVKFDPPTTLRSYIQSKGRARSNVSRYYIFSETSDSDFPRKISQFEKLEARLKYELVGKFLSRTLPTQEELNETIFKAPMEPFYPLGPDGPKIEGSTPISLINRYCNSLECDRFSSLTPYWWKENLISQPGVVVYLQLPNSSPVRETIMSDPFSSVELAKRSAALKACKLLYECQELDDNMLPCGKRSQQLENKQLYPCWREDEQPAAATDEADGDVTNKSPLKQPSPVGTKKCKNIYLKKFPECMCECRPEPGKKVYMHIIRMKPVYEVPKGARKKAFYDLLNSDFGYAFLSTKQWPTLLKFPLFITIGEIEIEVIMNKECQSLTNDEIEEIFNFHCTIFSDVLQCINLFMFRDYDNKEHSYLLAPVKLDAGRHVINWSVIRNNQEFPEIVPPTVEERKNIVVTEEVYKHSVVIPWYRGFLPRQAYIVTDLSETETALSNFPSGEYLTYENYFVTKYEHVVQLYSAEKPLLEVRALSKKLNCLKPRQSVQATSKRKKKQEEEFEESLVPELCVRSNLPAAYWLKATLLPSCVHRTTYLLLADELRVKMTTYLNVGTVTLPPGKSWRPMSVDQQCLREEEEAQQPILPTARTVTIKPKKALDLDTSQYPWGAEQEPIDIERNIEKVKLIDIIFYNEFVSKPIVQTKIKELAENNYDNRMDVKIEKLTFIYKSAAPDLSIFKPKHNDLGIELADVLQVLTAASAHDIFNFERLETLGDSFLKYAVSLILFTHFPELSEGQLTMIKGKIIGNRNLFYCGEEKELGSIIKNVEFNTSSDWVAPGFCVDRSTQSVLRDLSINPRYLYEIMLSREEKEAGQLSDTTKDMIEDKLYEVWEEDKDYANYSNANFISQQVVSNKTVSDSVEALLGLSIKSFGLDKGFEMLRWLKVTDPNLIKPDVYMEKKVEPTILSRGEINFHIHQPDYLEKLINYKFKHRAFLLQALSHPTYQPNNITPTYQRLEFLGDAILDFLITTYIFEQCAQLTPGELTDLRSALVNNVTLASVSVRAGFHKHLLLRSCQLSKVIESFVERQESRDHEFSDENLFLINEIDSNMGESIEVPKILGDVFESLVGAIFLDSNRCLKTTWAFIYRFMHKEIEMFSKKVPKNHVRLLYEENVQALFRKSVVLPDVNRIMVVVVIVVADKAKKFYGLGETKREAKRAAAKMALRFLRSN
nr:Dicer 2 [Sogatella furcifera]WOZ50366.1 endoribonuclease Dcr 2-like protein [Sogatella furcifera]